MTTMTVCTVATAISARLEARFAEELASVEDATLVRRCADVTELLSAAESGAVTVAAISPDFPGMNGSVVAELTVRGASVLGVVSATSALDARQCEAWSLRRTHVVGSGELEQAFETLAHTGPAEHELSAAAEQAETSLATDGPDDGAAAASSPTSTTVVVWGPPGAPGRTTCATHLAQALSESGPTLLVDADTVAPSCSAHLGLLDEAPGVLAAARLVDAGTLNLHQLRSIAAHVTPGFDVLTGIGHSGRWHELTRFHLGRVLDLAAQHYRWVVIDVAAEVEADESLLFDTVAPSRVGVSSEAFARADHVVALAGCDPVSLQRFVQHAPAIIDLHDDVRVVVSKARERAVGGSASSVVADALERFLGVRPVAVLPDVRDALDAAVLRGTLLEGADGAPYLAAVRDLASELGADVAAHATRRRRAWRRR
ncbi:ParA family protein [Dermacoccus sp. Ellin185]|uniref:AAA family ATPase n=1 Tax=Dermacoccus sp. Ellin185 TaxID=188626 RepID=UPI0001E644B9|nr:ParA family protein [Dermacoccus sp. Ellin185]EFP57860.1 hypothetical protein HMPREF0321_2254 [Dermacoccus sp. Ellin185]